MLRLFKSFLFKITKDMTFRITLIVGGGFALIMTGLFALLQFGLLDAEEVEESGDIAIRFISGQGMLITSLNPAQNFAIAVPINLVIFICLEFTQGAIRNKIIAGHSKFKIYVSLYLSGLVYAFALIGAYVLLCTALGTIFGGFNLEDYVFSLTGAGQITGEYLIKMAVVAIVTYTSIVSFSIFIATLFRNIGPCIPVVFVLLTFLSTMSIMAEMMGAFSEEDPNILLEVLRIVDPLYALSAVRTTGDILAGETPRAYISNLTFIGTICSNLAYATAFFFGGAALFKRRDVK